VPHINEPAYDPLWAVCEELGVPISFHSGASPRIQMRPGDDFSPALAAAFSNVVRPVSSIAVVANFMISRVLHRFPKLKIVFAESSLGWGAYEMEYADYQSDADGLPSEGYPLKPSELFQRQCYFTCWYDRASLRARNYLGSANSDTYLCFVRSDAPLNSFSSVVPISARSTRVSGLNHCLLPQLASWFRCLFTVSFAVSVETVMWWPTSIATAC